MGDRFGMILYGSLAGVALLLAALGGFMELCSLTVAQRIPEIGLREWPFWRGAQRCDYKSVAGRHDVLAVGGLVIGMGGAYFVALLSDAKQHCMGREPWIGGRLGAVAAILLFAALLGLLWFQKRDARAP